MFEVTVTGADELQARLEAMPGAIRAALLAKAQELSDALLAKVMGKLDGEVLQARTGRLKDSIRSLAEQSGDDISSSVFVDGDVPYAAIQEYGGTTKAHIIEATNAKALAFSWAGKASFFRHVNHPGSVIGEHSYLRSSLEDMQEDAVDAMGDALQEAVNGQ